MSHEDKPAKPPLRQRLIHEVKHVGVITLYFFVCFTIIGTLKMLFLAEYGVEVAGIGKVVVGALVIGKVVAVMDMTSWGDRFKNHLVATFVLYRSVIYTIAVAIALSAERVIHELGHADSLGEALRLAMATSNASRFWALVLCLLITFLGYNTLLVIGRQMGEGKLVSFLFSKPPQKQGSS